MLYKLLKEKDNQAVYAIYLKINKLVPKLFQKNETASNIDYGLCIRCFEWMHNCE
jgi:hypothetical protein